MSDISDRPLTDPKDDLFGYSPFAENLAKSIVKMETADGFVIGIHGKWGSGKSTLLNFIKYYLKNPKEKEVNNCKNTKDGEVKVITFNPWWFSGYEDLTRRFFEELRADVDKWGTRWGSVKSAIGKFSGVVSSLNLPLASTASGALSTFGEVNDSLDDLKNAVCKAIKKNETTIVVFIDDIDRLSDKEVCEVFRLIKSVADFPYIVYLISFDREVVIDALDKLSNGRGGKYLDKIVQLSFDLPPIDQERMDTILFARLNAVVKMPMKLEENLFWMNTYYDGIQLILDTPRKANKLGNEISVIYELVRDEVNPADFIAIETIHIFYPKIYDFIKSNKKALAGVMGTSQSGDETTDIKSTYEELIKITDEKNREPILKMLVGMFPKLRVAVDNYSYTNDFMDIWNKALRICHPDRFDTYFKLNIPDNTISERKFKEIMASSNERSSLFRWLDGPKHSVRNER